MESSGEFNERRSYYLQTLNNRQKKQLNRALKSLPEGRRDGLWELLCSETMQLNREQHEALLHDHTSEGPLLILAGPGSGKTAVMVRRIVYLLLRGTAPENILAATFTNKAGREMKDRAQELFARALEKCSTAQQEKLKEIEERIDKAWIGTFHSLGHKILELELPYSSRPLIKKIRGRFHLPLKILDSEKSKKLFGAAYGELSNPTRSLHSLKEQIYKWRNNLITYKAARKKADSSFEKTAARLYENYQKQKFRHDPPALDFQDLLNYPTQILRDNSPARKFLQNKFEHILIDEYQDTDPVQFLFCRLLSKKHGRLFAVGDDAQSIYGWRGADITNIQQFKDSFSGAKIVCLQKNYRSNVNIVMAANQVFSSEDEVYEKHLKPGKGDAKGLEYGKPIAVFECLSAKEQRGFLDYEIKRLVENRDYNYGDMAIFYRLNRQQKPIKQLLEKRNIPHVVLGDKSFLEKKKTRLFCSLLKILQGIHRHKQNNLEDTDDFHRALKRWWTREGSSLEDKSKRRLKQHLTPFKILINDRAAADFKKDLDGREVEFIENEARLFLQFYRTLKRGGLIMEIADSAARLLEIDPSGEVETKKPDEFCVLFYDWIQHTQQGKGFEGLDIFLENLARQHRDPQFVPGDPQKFVKLTTLHGAKGLEFPVVFFTGLEEGVCPFIPPHKSKLEAKKLNEEKRLFYVGITRAEERLNLLWGSQRELFGEIKSMEKSRFLELLPGDLTTTVQPPRSLWQEIKAAFVR